MSESPLPEYTTMEAKNKAEEQAKTGVASVFEGAKNFLGGQVNEAQKTADHFEGEANQWFNLKTEETNGIDMKKRYGDVPEGIDQFGGENIERESGAITVGSDITKLTEGVQVQRHGEAPLGIDQFGAESVELEGGAARHVAPNNETIQVVRMEKYKDAPAGIDQFGGEGSEGTRRDHP